MSKEKILTVNWHEIVLFAKDNEDFICLTDIIKSIDSTQKVEKRMSNRSTVDFLGTWEAMHNTNFDFNKFWDLRSDSWNNTFTLSVKRRVDETKAIGIFSKLGKFWGVYAHKDIAFEFASWLSPQFKLYIIKEFQRLKEEEQNKQALWRDVKRFIVKANYRIQTDAIKENLTKWIEQSKQRLIYSWEADMLNIAVFWMTSSERARKNPKKAQNWNIRDEGTIEELTVLSNLEILNAEMIKNHISEWERLNILCDRAKEQLATFSKLSSIKKLKESEEKKEIKMLWTH